LFFGVLHNLNATRPPLQRVPNRQQTAIRIFPPLMIPEPERFDALIRQSLFANRVPFHFFRRTVLKTVKLNRQLRIGAVKIQDASAKPMLPPEFETGKPPPPQRPPKLSFFVGLMAAQFAGYWFQVHPRKDADWRKNIKPLTPALSPPDGARETNRESSSFLPALKVSPIPPATFSPAAGSFFR
jgi:hypothetical protein